MKAILRSCALVALAGLLVACQGESVAAPSPGDTGTGDGTGDTGTGDTADTTVALDGDSAPTEAATDALVDGDAGACVSTADNLVPNGDFVDGLAGWQLTSTDGAAASDEVAPPCGKAVHLFATKLYGAMSREVKRAFPKGTRVRLRGWFKQRAGTKGDTPAFFGQFYHPVDGGSLVTTEEVWVRTVLDSGWTMVEATKTLEQDEISVSIVVGSTRGDGKDDDFAVAGLSLVVVE